MAAKRRPRRQGVNALNAVGAALPRIRYPE
jgi:hypothetical protein